VGARAIEHIVTSKVLLFLFNPGAFKCNNS